MLRYKKLDVYKEALGLTKAIRDIKSVLPKSEEYGLRSQITRAMDSVVLNIAEGSDRYTDKDFSRFLNQAIASLSEVMACLDIAETSRYIKISEINGTIESIEILYKKLYSLCGKVRNSSGSSAV